MKISCSTQTMLAGAWLLGVLLCPQSHALVFDSFIEGPFYPNETPISGPFASSRQVTLGPRTTPLVDTLKVIADINQGSFTFNSQDTTPAEPWRNLYIQIRYFNSNTFDVSSYAGFAFDFSDLVGTGDLVIEIGRGPIIQNETTRSTPITEPGWLVAPMNTINYSAQDDALNAFYTIRFTFRATSPTFGFTLNEIALTTVPEPASAAALLGATVLAAATVRRRRRGNRYTGI